MIYLDNAATTQLDPEVFEAMQPYLRQEYGNPGSMHQMGRAAERAVENAREQVADFLGCQPTEVIFTSGGTEANNTALFGVRDHLTKSGRQHILISSVEHDSINAASGAMMKHGFDVETIPVNRRGSVEMHTVTDMIRQDTGLVSVMFVNNETGSRNDVVSIGNLCRSEGIIFHTDCVQAAGVFSLPEIIASSDLASISSHKIHGPKGVGALYVRSSLSKGQLFQPLIYGGHAQEFGLRGGTANVPGIVGFGVACQLSKSYKYSGGLKNKLYLALRNKLYERGLSDRLHVNGVRPSDRGKTLNIRIDGVDSESLLLLLDANGVCVSTGSACRSLEIQPSHTLTSMGLSEEEARSSFRISFSRMNTPEEAVRAGEIIADCTGILLESSDIS